jgi:hypothetical protein
MVNRASSYRLLDGANSNTVEGFSQRGRKRSKKLRGRGGFQAAFPLYQMNRHKQQTPEKPKQKANLKQEKHMQTKQSAIRSTVIAAFGLLSTLLAVSQTAQAQDIPSRDSTPVVFQAAGATTESIQSSVDAFRAALGIPNNLNNPGPLTHGRREINWDGGNPNVLDTTAPVTPFNVFLNTRGSQFTTPGIGLSQAPPSGGPQGGLAVLFGNPSYDKTFRTFSPSRLFTPVGSNITNALFFIPGTNGNVAATVRGFGAVFTDVDQQADSNPNHKASTLIEYLDKDSRILFSSSVPASPGGGNLSFFGIVFGDARIAAVRVQAGNVAPGPNDDKKHDIVMMDDFIYGEPQLLK